MLHLSACTDFKKDNKNSLIDNKPTTPEEKVVEKPKVDVLKEKIKAMTLEEKVGQLVIVGLDEYTNNAHSKEMLEKYKVGGFILFEKNIKDAKQMLSLINSLKQSNLINKTPLFLSIDEEGGRVTRMPKEFLKLPSNKYIGQFNNSQLSYNIGTILGKELKSFGLNMDFAPVLDINSNAKNPVIGDRSFGANEKLVSKLGLETMKGIQKEKVIPVIKHFPGHGDTSVDSHIGLPVVNTTLSRLKSFELVPFKEAIDNGADMVMIAHILMPKIDGKNPASFSKVVITDILRKDLNFNGVVITDDMTMGAVMKNFKIEEAAVMSLKAGTDIVLVCHNYNNQIKVIDGIKKSIESGNLPMEEVDEKLYRILKLKNKYNLKDDIVQSIDIPSINEKIKSVLNIK